MISKHLPFGARSEVWGYIHENNSMSRWMLVTSCSLERGGCRQLGIITYHRDVVPWKESSSAHCTNEIVPINLLAAKPRCLCLCPGGWMLYDVKTLMCEPDPELVSEGISMIPSLLKWEEGKFYLIGQHLPTRGRKIPGCGRGGGDG